MMKLKWWHKDPVATLTNRRNNLIELFNEGKEYPIVIRMFGFPKLIIYSKQEHYARIRELTDILKSTTYSLRN